MAAPPQKKQSPPKPSAGSSADYAPEFVPYVTDRENIPELTWMPVIVGVLLGIVFGASSLYLVLKVGMTVSASIPVAVLSITVFRVFAKVFRVRQATILENNIVQTAGSAGESIAFGVAVTMPALLLLGFEMSLVRVMTVGVLGGLLGILMMIPLRRAFIVRQHGKLPYPEGTACADVLIAGEKGGATALTVFGGFGLAFVHKFCMQALGLWKDTVSQPLITESGVGLKGAVIGGELTPELLGVGYIIGPRIGSIMVAGGVLAYLVLTPAIVLFGGLSDHPLPPANAMLIRDMGVREIRDNYILYIGAGAVVAGGILSMFQALPLIIGSLRAAFRDLAATKGEGTKEGQRGKLPRTQRDLPLSFVVLGTIGLVIALAAIPSLGLGFNQRGILAACLIVAFGFLFVTVSSRLTGEIGSSSNPISGMTVATLLLTSLIFVYMGHHEDPASVLTALTIAAVVCIAASNGGTTSQDLKTGYLVGATPKYQQIAILVGALTSALVIGGTLLLLNDAGTVYTKNAEYLPHYRVPDAKLLPGREAAGGQYAGSDTKLYYVWHAGEGQVPGVPQGKYLVDETGLICYLVDPAINGRINEWDNGRKVPNKFEAPKTKLMALIIDGIFNGRLPWQFVLLGALIAVVLELSGVPALPFAVGMYLPIQISVPIFIGGLLRWLVDKIRKQSAAEAESSPGVLLSSGYIAGGSIAGVVIAFFAFAPDWFNKKLNIGANMSDVWKASNWPAMGAFGLLLFALFIVGWGKLSSGSKPNSEQED